MCSHFGRLRHDRDRAPVSSIPCSRYLRFRDRLDALSIDIRLMGIVSLLRQYVHAKHDAAKNGRVQEADAYTAQISSIEPRAEMIRRCFLLARPGDRLSGGGFLLRCTTGQKHLEVAEQAMKTTQAILNRSKDRFESGVVVESDYLSAKVRTATGKQKLIRAVSLHRFHRAELVSIRLYELVSYHDHPSKSGRERVAWAGELD